MQCTIVESPYFLETFAPTIHGGSMNFESHSLIEAWAWLPRRLMLIPATMANGQESYLGQMEEEYIVRALRKNTEGLRALYVLLSLMNNSIFTSMVLRNMSVAMDY